MVQIGQQDLKGENIERAVRGIANQLYKMKQVLTIQTSSNMTETFFRENAGDLTASGTRNIRGVDRLSAFPNVVVESTKVSADHLKYAAEGVISMEDVLLDAIDVQARTIDKIARAVAKSVDDRIYIDLSAATGILTAAATANWDAVTEADRDPIFDILTGIQTLDENNYDVLENGFLLLSPKDHTNLIRNSKIINNPSFKTADVVSNGRVGQIAGLTIIKSVAVTADEAIIIVGQRAATWKTAMNLTSVVIEDRLIKFTIRSAEIGQLQISAPAAIYKITNTQK